MGRLSEVPMTTKTYRWLSAALPLSLLAVGLAGGAAAQERKVRRPVVAGAFYPENPAELAKAVDGYLETARAPQLPDPLLALIAPHAGYMYSGAVAAHGYALLKGMKPERVVVISPSHVDRFGFAAIYDGDAYATPLGEIPVDRSFAEKLGRVAPEVKLSSRGHEGSGARGEHALEVQLPFLQRVLGSFRLVPVVMGDQSYEASRALGVALAIATGESQTLIVASSDLSHYHSYEEAVRLDKALLRAVEGYDYLSLSRNLSRQAWEACGGGPIIAAMIAAERLGATRARLLKYANSGDVTGDHSRVVGYAAVALYKPSGKSPPAAARLSLSPDEQDELLRIARLSVETAVTRRKLVDLPAPASPALTREQGAFVTLKKQGRLRGCIGYSEPLRPLYLTVRDVAAYAALQDRRFPPVEPGELAELEYEVSVLSPFRRVRDVTEIETGLHGLMIKQGPREGLLLPQVAPEQGWNRATLLEQLCLKAGLPAEAWKDAGSDIFRFTALVFPEHPKAPVSVGNGHAGSEKAPPKSPAKR